MKKGIRLLLSLLIMIGLFGVLNHSTKLVEAISPDANGNWYWGYQSQLDEDYYSDLNGITNPTVFEATLADILAEGAVKFSYGYKSNNTGDHLAYIDEDPNNTNNVLCMYTGRSISKNADHSAVGGWNQEHTWAKSHGFPEDGYKNTYPYCDLNHLRATECQINSTRGNLDFGEVTGGSSSYGCSWGSGYFEPRDSVKGDVARIMMYMDVRYDGSSANTSNVTLTLVNGKTSSSNGTGKFGDLATLLKWHVEDPVDDLERRRNDRVQDVQGNRNPFIDHPEYANIIYGTSYEEDENATYKVTYNVGSGVTFNYSDSKEYKKGDLITKPNVSPVKTGYEFVGWYSDAALSKAWNFNSNTITSNLTLYPKFSVILSATDSFALIDTQAKMKINANITDNGGTIEDSVTLSSFNGSGSINGLQKNSIVDMNEYINFDDSLFDIEYHTNNNIHCYVSGSKQEIRLYVGCETTNGSALVIKAKNSLVIDSVSTNNTSSDIKITISNDGKIATIQNINTANSGNVVVKSIKVNYSNSTSQIEVLNSQLAYRFEVDEQLLAELEELGSLKFGIKIGSKHTELPLVNGVVTYNYTAVELTDSFTVCGYVEINGQYYYTKAETYSIKTLAARYLSEMPNNSVVLENKALLKFLAK